MKKLIVAYLLFSCSFLSLQCLSASKVQPNKNTTTGFMQEINEQRIYTGKPRSGEVIYQYRCKGCHGKNTQGAPMPDDDYEWSVRLKKGLDVLYKHAINGYKNSLMPPLGGCRNCSDQEVYAAVRYMIETSGVKIPNSAVKVKTGHKVP